MGIDLQLPGLTELRPRIVVMGVGGAGGNAVNNMIESGLEGVQFIAANTDAQALSTSSAGIRIQMGVSLTEGLGAGSKPDIGAAAAEEAIEEIRSHLEGVHMLFITAGMGGGTGTGAAPVIARTAKELGVLTVAVVTQPFEFEGQRRMRVAEDGIRKLAPSVDTLIVIPNQNLFRIASEKTTFADAFLRADDVLRSGVCCITDLMIKDGLINLDFADVRTVMRNMGTALMGTGEAEGEKRALQAASAAISNPLLGDFSMRGAKGLLVSITGSYDMTLYEVEEAASRIKREVDPDENPEINIIVGATFDTSLKNRIRVSVVATGIMPGAEIFQTLQQNQNPALRGKDGRLSDRLSTAASQSQTRDGQPTQGTSPAHGSAKPQNTRQDAGGPKVILEPKPRKPIDGNSERYPQESQQSFEPVPPAKGLRAPRRPLTFEDFPELSEPAPAKNQAKRGLLDWMTGRRKDESHQSRGRSDVTYPQRTGHEKYNSSLNGRGRGNGSADGDYGHPDDRGYDERDARNAEDREQEVDIPNFFKKPPV